MIVWRDQCGEPIHPGDILLDVDCQIIGTAVWQYGLPAIRKDKKFNWNTLEYEWIARTAVDNAYIQQIIPKHSKLWLWMNNHCIPNIKVIRHAEGRRPRAPEWVQVPPYEAPTPWM